MKQQPEKVLGQLVDASADGLFAFDRDGRITAWNRTLERLTGFMGEQMMGQHFSEPFASLTEADRKKIVESVLEGNATHYDSSGDTRGPFQMRCSPILDAENNIVGGAVSVRRNVNYDSADPGESAYQRLASHLKNSPLAVIEWDSDFRVSRWSDSAERLFGWQAEEVIGKHVGEWKFVFTEDVDAVEQVTNRQRVGAEVYGVLRNRNYTKEGSILVCEWYNSVLHDAEGRLLSVLSLVLDVTARKLAEQERTDLLEREREARQQAQEADRLKDEFLATLSHELRTPLTSILGWSSMIRSGQVEGAAANRAIETIERNARAQARLIDDLLDVSRIITGNLRLDLHPLNLAPIVDAALDALRPTADAKGIKLNTDFECASCLVRGDSNRLRQVIWNLLSNAIKFTPRGGSVTVQLKCVDNSTHLTVSDTGEGIPRDFLPYVFDRFRQAEASNSRKQGGLGLGLAVVRHLVELHGGTVKAISEGIGLGSTFTVEVPQVQERRDPARAEERKREMERRRGRGEIRFDGVRVLLVEDDDDSRKLLEMMLKRHGADVVSCSTAALALARFTERYPDVLISDIAMPEQNGYEFLQHVRQLPAEQGGNTPAIALTGYATRRDRELALANGYQIHLAKPVEQSELVAAIASLVGRRE